MSQVSGEEGARKVEPNPVLHLERKSRNEGLQISSNPTNPLTKPDLLNFVLTLVQQRPKIPHLGILLSVQPCVCREVIRL